MYIMYTYYVQYVAIAKNMKTTETAPYCNLQSTDAVVVSTISIILSQQHLIDTDFQTLLINNK